MTLAHPDRYATLDRGVPARVRRVAILRPRIAGEGPAMVGTFQALDLAAWARQGANRKVYLVDAHAEPLSEGAIIERLAASNPDAIVVCDDGERPAGELGPLLAAVHRGLPLSLLIVAREQGLEGHLPADIGSYHFLLTGDTGEGLRALLQHIETGRREPARISGLVWRDADGHIQGNPAWHVGSDLPASPLPAWDLMPRGFDGTFALRTARICQSDCPTCHGAFGRTLRRRVIADVLHETQLLASGYGLSRLAVLDEAFDLDPRRAKALLRGWIGQSHRFELEFPRGLRGDRIDRELAQLLRAAGCKAVHLPIGSASPRLQQSLGTNLDLESLERGIAHLAAEGIHVTGRFGFGFEREDPKERARSVEFARRCALHAVEFAPIGARRHGNTWSARLAAHLRFATAPERAGAWRKLLADRNESSWQPALHRTFQAARRMLGQA
ncbi:MAG: hypothetical protein R3F17_17220 [Planctomycetota bacterium]